MLIIAGCTASGSTAPRSINMRIGLVAGTPRRMMGPRSSRARGRWTTIPSRREYRWRVGIVTSIGSFLGRSTPHSAAAVRCDAIVPGPVAHTAARARWCNVGGLPHNLATPGYNASCSPSLKARYQAARLTPSPIATSRVTRPWCPRANLSSGSSFTHVLGTPRPADRQKSADRPSSGRDSFHTYETDRDQKRCGDSVENGGGVAVRTADHDDDAFTG